MTQIATAWHGTGTTNTVGSSATVLELSELINEPSAAPPFAFVASADEVTISRAALYSFRFGGNATYVGGASPSGEFFTITLQEDSGGGFADVGTALKLYPGSEAQGGTCETLLSVTASDVFRMRGVSSTATYTYDVDAWLTIVHVGAPAAWLEIQTTGANVLTACGAPPRLVAGWCGWCQQALAQGTGLHTDPIQGASAELANFIGATTSQAARDGGPDQYVLRAITALDNYATDAATIGEGPAIAPS